ncbi:tartrate dehydrogenase/decarboxylase/D-malate dehydrogenase [Virgibacillus natechei]|uniref:D-malate dehydrogenase (decarboxylating) n=1 Tax=Virgibacillus natechei TaxID=1216297 RepID=A0ABS4IIC8_9BACI|nr:tartrate dehydrogenase [Virgibacillus natechei]MBP1970101.1 tartrate dehydrogenase/decarboxylase/D-malate dehydrogenase [Virgibacillus natechei]UZD14180.1 tartrate dehydrogenase [Virgibacillus natechei]
MKNFNIALIPGDGIGSEVVSEGVKILKEIEEMDAAISFSFAEFPWGCEYYLEHGKMMADDGIEQLQPFDAIYLGAVGYPGVPDHISLRELLLQIRKGFDQYVNLRPITLLNPSLTPLKSKTEKDVDFLVIRENSEGEYSGAGDWLYKGKPEEVVLQTGVFSRKGTERIIRYAYEEARKSNRTLTSVSKANALNYSMVFWDEVFEEVGKEYPDVETYSYLVDAASLYFVAQPERFEVVVTSNLFGDILTDIGAAITGGLGLATGANVNPERNYPSMFEPVHGSAPDIAGKGIANPIAAIWSVSQMMDFFGEEKWGEAILSTIKTILKETEQLTPDLGGQGSTKSVGDRFVELLKDNRIT